MSTEPQLYECIIDRMGWVKAMALQIGGEKFSEWNDEIRQDYAHAMCHFTQEVKELAGQWCEVSEASEEEKS